MYHIFFIHPPVGGHLDCFHVLAIVTSAPMNSGVAVSFQIRFSSGYMPRSGVARSYGSSVFSFFKEPLCCFPPWLHPLTFPPAVEEGVDLGHVKVQFASVWQVAPDASWELGWGLWTNTFILLYHRLLLDAWASSQERDWVPEGSIPEEPGGNCIAFTTFSQK